MFTLNSVSKESQLRKKRVKPTQRQLGAISTKVRAEVKLRSGGSCEVLQRCHGAEGVHMAHLTSRKQLTYLTTAKDLLHSCVECHIWLDSTVSGITYKRQLRGGDKPCI